MNSSNARQSLVTILLTLAVTLGLSMVLPVTLVDDDKSIDDCEVDVGGLSRTGTGWYVKGSIEHEPFADGERFGTYLRITAPSSAPLRIKWLDAGGNEISKTVEQREMTELWVYYDTAGTSPNTAFIHTRDDKFYAPATTIKHENEFNPDGAYGEFTHNTGELSGRLREWKFVSVSYDVTIRFSIDVLTYPGPSDTRHPNRLGRAQHPR